MTDGHLIHNPVFVHLAARTDLDCRRNISRAEALGWPCILLDEEARRISPKPNVLRVPTLFIGHSKEPDWVQHGRAYALAASIHEVLKRRTAVIRPQPTPAAPEETVVVTRLDRRHSWRSLQEVLPAIEMSWAAAARIGRHAVRFVRFDPKRWLSCIPRLWNARRVVIPCMDPFYVELIRVLRECFSFSGQFVINDHGESTYAARLYIGCQDTLRDTDLLAAASHGARRAIRLCYANARTEVIRYPTPFLPGCQLSSQPSARHGPKKRALMYAGRISEQKNLHVLFVALWLLRERYGIRLPTLEIFGEPDGFGSPNMGLASDSYLRYLKQLSERLGLDRQIRWHGKIPRHRLQRWVMTTPHIFVSASLHSDENFGVAALTSLAAGRTAVLSAWGGHLDLRRLFRSRTFCVPVQGTRAGPALSPMEFADALRRALRDPEPSPASKDAVRPFRLSQVELAIRRQIFLRKGRGERLQTTDIVRRLQKREKDSPLFHGYEDPAAQPFFSAYGMPPASVDVSPGRGPLLVLPWVLLRGGGAQVEDPHRGGFEMKPRLRAVGKKDASTLRAHIPGHGDHVITPSVAGWLLERGFAFPGPLVPVSPPVD